MKSSFVIVTLVAGLSAVAGAAPAIENHYAVTAGKKPEGGTYLGAVGITASTTRTGGDQGHTVFDVQRMIDGDDGNGQGLISRSTGFDKYLGVAWGPGAKIGVFVWCQQMGDPSSVCVEWAGGGEENAIPETTTMSLSKGKPDRWVGTFDVDGASFDTVAITKIRGKLYAITWLGDGNERGKGIGIEGGKGELFVVWGGDGTKLAVYKIAGKKLDGTWGRVGNRTLGTEKLTVTTAPGGSARAGMTKPQLLCGLTQDEKVISVVPTVDGRKLDLPIGCALKVDMQKFDGSVTIKVAPSGTTIEGGFSSAGDFDFTLMPGMEADSNYRSCEDFTITATIKDRGKTLWTKTLSTHQSCSMAKSGRPPPR